MGHSIKMCATWLLTKKVLEPSLWLSIKQMNGLKRLEIFHLPNRYFRTYTACFTVSCKNCAHDRDAKEEVTAKVKCKCQLELVGGRGG